MAEYPTFHVSRRHRQPLLAFMTDALEADGCRLIYVSSADEAPFRLTFETAAGERLGIVAYAFLANSRPTRHRPPDEHRFQMKYGSKDGRLHDLWQDPYGLYTTLLVGINPELGMFVGADPVLHSPTRFFISVEFKQAEVEAVLQKGWHTWEREHRSRDGRDDPVEALVGGTQASFLRYIRFEREVLGEDQGHRGMLAERLPDHEETAMQVVPLVEQAIGEDRLHALAREFALSETEVLDLIASARRLKMAVRGWVAEEHLYRQLRSVPGVSDCERLDDEGGADVRLRFNGSELLTIECKNVLRKRTAAGVPRLDFQRTRASRGDPCSRYYSPTDFNVVAACLHAVSERWEFRYSLPSSLAAHRICVGKLDNNVRVDEGWSESVVPILAAAAGTL